MRVWVEAGAHVGGYLNASCCPSRWTVKDVEKLSDEQRRLVVTDGNGGGLQGIASIGRSGWVEFEPVEGGDITERQDKPNFVPATGGQICQSADGGIVEPTVGSRPPEQREPQQYPPADHLRGPE